MLRGNKKKTSRPGSGVETLIGQHARICGDIHFDGGLYIEGVVEGAVIAEQGSSSAVLTLAERGRIEGEVRAPVVVLNGHLVGDIHSNVRVELGPASRIEGDIHYAVVEMQAGAAITGRLIHESGAPKQLTGPEPED